MSRRTESSSPPEIPVAGTTGIVAALLASTCCILPILLILSGLAGAGLMMNMMRYEWITLPLGTIGIVAAWALYFRQKRRCETTACRFVGRRANQVLLGIATLVVVTSLLLRLFPSWTAAILQTPARPIAVVTGSAEITGRWGTS
ncbi:MAG: hypothetical protein ACE5HV_12925 [Acidobacteriota bacterium]